MLVRINVWMKKKIKGNILSLTSKRKKPLIFSICPHLSHIIVSLFMPPAKLLMLHRNKTCCYHKTHLDCIKLDLCSHHTTTTYLFLLNLLSHIETFLRIYRPTFKSSLCEQVAHQGGGAEISCLNMYFQFDISKRSTFFTLCYSN